MALPLESSPQTGVKYKKDERKGNMTYVGESGLACTLFHRRDMGGWILDLERGDSVSVALDKVQLGRELVARKELLHVAVYGR